MLTRIYENIRSKNCILAKASLLTGKLSHMKFHQTNNISSTRLPLAAVVAMLLLPVTVFGQELGEPLLGPEFLSDTVQIEHSSFANCALQNTGRVFCWGIGLGLPSPSESFISDAAGSSTLNAALNNDIASITLDAVHLCGIGRESGIACVPAIGRNFSANGAVQFPPEPDASYLSISDLGRLNSGSVCAIQTDNRVVCWGSTLIGNIPPEAAFLKQVDIVSSRACGIDLNDSVVCWGRPTLNAAGVDAQFGNVEIATIGPIKQISLSRSGACLIDMNDRLECFGEMSGFTDIFSEVPLSSIEVGGTFTFGNTDGLCYETTSGEKDCQVLTFSEDGTSSDSILSPDADARLISPRNGVCYITEDETMKCTVLGGSPDQNQFPTAPQNLSFDLFSDTQGELTWARPSVDRSADDFALGYEIFRDGVLIDRLPVVTSYFDSNTNPNASYEVRATRGLIAGTSSFVNADGSDDSLIPTEPSPSTPVPAPTTPTIPSDGSGEIGLTGTVYSSTALELFYNNVQVGSSTLTFNILRDGVVIRENSPATSQFQGGLDVNTTYRYEVQAVLDGNIISTDNITLTTFDDGSGPVAPASDVNVILSAAVYSSSALELFWNRAPVPNVTYNIFRDGELVRQNSPAISQFNGQLPPNNTFQYEVVALLDGEAVASSSIVIDTRTGTVSEPIASGTQPPSPGPQQGEVGPIELAGVVYSSTALELMWQRAAIPSVTYTIFRDGEIIRENSAAISQFQSGLLPNTRYLYTVIPFVNGIEQVSETIELSTRSL